MFALGSKADAKSMPANVRFVPVADIQRDSTKVYLRHKQKSACRAIARTTM
jgi:hypothetical protein